MNCSSLRGRFAAGALSLLLALGGSAVAAEPAAPEILPPPPELLTGSGSSEETQAALQPLAEIEAPAPVVQAPVLTQPATPAPAYEPVDATAGTFTPRSTYVSEPYSLEPSATPGNIVYTAPDRVDPMFQGDNAVRIPVHGGGYVSRGIVISPPSANMPADYFDLPLTEDAIPGVLLPELEDGYSYGGVTMAPASPVRTGMSVRQLDPFFALAKGSEGAALDAKRGGNDGVFNDQLLKARDAYMSIVAMADAGGEAREEAWYGVARCEYRLGNWWKSFEALERSFPEEYQPGEVTGRMKLESFIGERLWGFGVNPAPDAVVQGEQLDGYRAAARVYKALVFNEPLGEGTPLALLRQGDAASMHGNWEEATRLYRQLVDYFPDSEQSMQGRSSLAEAIYRQEWPTGFPEAARRDVQVIMEDVERSETTLSVDAADRRRRAVEIANDLDAEIKLRHAKEYLRSVRLRKSRDGAVFLLKDIVTLYPNTKQASEASEILVALGETPPAPSGQSFSPFAPPASMEDRYGPAAVTDDPFAAAFEDPFADSGYVTLDVPSDIPNFALPESPTRETVYERLPDPVPVE